METQLRLGDLEVGLHLILQHTRTNLFQAVVSNSVFCDVYNMVVQLFTSAVTWDPSASPSLWGVEVEPHGHFAYKCTERFGSNQRYPQQLRIFKQPFAIGGMRLAYYALEMETGRRHASHLLETSMSL